jgi:hypothetical protein
MITGVVFGTMLLGCSSSSDDSNTNATGGSGSTATGGNGSTATGGSGSSNSDPFGVCTERATTLLTLDRKDEIVDVAVSGSTLYLAVVRFNGGALQYQILSMPTAGGATTPVATLDEDGIYALVVDSDYVYSVGGSHLMKTPKSGGTPVLLATIANGNSYKHNLGVDETQAYFNYNGVNSVKKSASLVSSDGYTKVTTNGVNSLVLNGGTVYFTSDDTVYKAATTSVGTDTVLAEGFSNLNALALCGDQVVFVDDSSGSGSSQQLYKVAAAGGSKVALGSSFNNVNDTPIVCDGTNVYFSSDYFSVNRIPLAGGTPTTVSCSTGATTLVADSTTLYWVGYNTNILYSLKK